MVNPNDGSSDNELPMAHNEIRSWRGENYWEGRKVPTTLVVDHIKRR